MIMSLLTCFYGKMLTSTIWAWGLYLTQWNLSLQACLLSWESPEEHYLGAARSRGPAKSSWKWLLGCKQLSALAALSGTPAMLPGLPRLIFRLWECLLKWVIKLGLYIQSSFQDLTSFPSRASWVHSLSWLAFKVTSPRVNWNRTHHLWVGGLPPPWMMCGEQPWDALTRQSFWASPGSVWVYAHPEKPSLSREVTMKSLPVIKFTHSDQNCVYISICN